MPLARIKWEIIALKILSDVIRKNIARFKEHGLTIPPPSCFELKLELFKGRISMMVAKLPKEDKE